MLLYFLFQLDPSIVLMFLPNYIFNILFISVDLSTLHVMTYYLLYVLFYS
jgi:hypothetical protein